MAFTALPKELTRKYPHGARIIRRPFPINVSLSMVGESENALAPDPEGFITAVGTQRVAGDEVFLGIAGLKSLDLLSAIGKKSGHRHARAVLFDLNECQLDLMQDVIELIKTHKDPAEFIKEFSARYPQYLAIPPSIPASKRNDYDNTLGIGYMPPVVTAPKGKLTPVELMLQSAAKHPTRYSKGKEISWLRKENYQAIRAMVLADDIVCITLDMRDEKRMRRLKSWFDQQQLRVADVYLSSSLDFVDPYLKTDYYSTHKYGRAKLARSFYDNLLALTGEDTRFLVSVANPRHPILQTYHLERFWRDAIETKAKNLPAHEPHWREKACLVVFEAGEQHWRLQSFEGAKGRYFRIFSEKPAKDKEELEEQIDKINETLRMQENHNLVLKLPGPRQYPNRQVEEQKDPTVFYERAFFASEAALPSAYEAYAMRASQPFMLTGMANADTLDRLVENIQFVLAPEVKRRAWLRR